MIPCKDCITLPICRSTVYKHIDHYPCTSQDMKYCKYVIVILKSNCILLGDYLFDTYFNSTYEWEVIIKDVIGFYISPFRNESKDDTL